LDNSGSFGSAKGDLKFTAYNLSFLFDIPATFDALAAVSRQNKKPINFMDNNLREVLMAPAVLGSLGWAVYIFVKTMTNYILKKKMIEKGFVNDDTQAIFKNDSPDYKYSSLKWGIILLFAGLALVLMEFVPTSPDSPLPYGIAAVSVSLGFLVYYFIVKKEIHK
jgi:hypothetical protein